MSVKITHNMDNAIKKLQSLISGKPERIVMSAMDGLDLAGRLIAQKIMDNPDVPEEYKMSVGVVRLDSERKVLIGPVLDWAYMLEKGGTDTQFLLTRCPKQKYFTGALKRPIREITTEPILERVAEGSIQEIVDYVKYEVNRLIRELL